MMSFFLWRNHVVKRMGYAILVILVSWSNSVISDELKGNADKPRVGVYYFPGWKDHAEPTREFPWKPILDFYQRKPLLGWYQEGDDNITVQHLRWMHEYSINYVIYDWYWTPKNYPRLDHAIESYLRVPFVKHQTNFAIMWANHVAVPNSEQQFRLIVDHWVKHLFSDPRYETINGRPVLIVFSPENLEKCAQSFGRTASDLMRILRNRSKDLISKDPFVVGVTHAVHHRVNGSFLEQGYDAYTAYNYHYPVRGVFRGANYSHSYPELVDGYTITWDWMLNHSSLPYIIPITSGWDRRPWGGSKDYLHDNSGGDPVLFQAHARKAVDVVRGNPEKTLNRIHVCCWNEFGEGSFIEPTYGYGFDFLKGLLHALK